MLRGPEMGELTRRDVFKGTGAVGAAAIVDGALGTPARARPRGKEAGEADIVDVAVIGAGVSGAYAAWRLLGPEAERSSALKKLRRSGRGPLRVHLFEGSERVGGRLFSVTPPGMPHLHAELGGMRYLDNQPVVADLVDHLGLPTDPFPVDEPQNLVYLRRHRFTQAQWNDPTVVPYDLPAAIRGKSPDDALVSVIERFVPGAAGMNQKAWDKIKPTASADGRHLYDIGFWNLLLDAVGQEGWSFLRDGFGYGSVVANVNSIEAMEASVADFVGSPAPQYLLLRNGYQTVPEELVRRFEAEGGTVHLHHQVRRIDRETVHGEDVLTLALSVWPTGRPLTVRARHVVLAMPQRSIELLDPDTFLFTSDRFLSDLGSIVPRPASKLFLGYDRPWWEDLGLRAGRSVTDLPLRQTYYWGVEGKQPGADPADRNALLLASYNDLSDVEFWNELLTRPHRLAPVAVTRPPRPMDASAPGTLVDEAQRQLRELHGPDARIPDPTSAYFQDWVQDPYGAAFHFWQVGAKSWEIMPRMRHPLPDANLYVCGDAWSTGQGWVYGALTQAELMLEEHFGLPRPTWLSPSTYLGP
ncbi:flavin monoamine oxidase family protein [Streptomyces sp. Tue6028]|uniref:flavin monoamine oxidase family protein n=1 Tax=Streptomyces sp. Tue6028 TaxID=2036037 RepID=UPI0015C727E1|nr:NAD(P)/FAD-dependent oxidoreductase [Streptomyces sp. Tue6028]